MNHPQNFRNILKKLEKSYLTCVVNVKQHVQLNFHLSRIILLLSRRVLSLDTYWYSSSFQNCSKTHLYETSQKMLAGSLQVPGSVCCSLPLQDPDQIKNGIWMSKRAAQWALSILITFRSVFLTLWVVILHSANTITRTKNHKPHTSLLQIPCQIF